MEYIAKITQEGRQWLVEFPDCPGCQTYGNTREEALENATEALEGWLETSLEHGDVPPKPVSRRGGIPVVIDARLEACIRVRWLRTDMGWTQGQLAKIIGVSQQQVAKLEKPVSNPTIRTLQAVTDAAGVRFRLGYNEPWIGVAREATTKLGTKPRAKSAR